ncbi:hypothetical protein NC651_038680 [Populus alba x Populus x berolinensis]|nr:hypothetical protein NC651_038680 [Populus alba x Populus x berolinensis]
MNSKLKLRQAIDTLYTNGPASHECYTRLALECFRASDVDQAKRLKSHMDLHLFKPKDTFIHNRLLNLYAKSGEISHARKLFDEMTQRDNFSWNAMLSLYAKSGKWARRPGTGMQKEGHKPTEYTHVSVLNACTQLLDLRRGKQIHGRIIICNLGGNVFVCNALTDLYARCGEIDQARKLFDRMVIRNVVSNLKPDQVTVSSVLGAYIQGGYIDEARKVFGEVREKDEVCWTTMIVGCAQNGKEEDALLLFSEMLLENARPDGYTISSVVSSCAKLASLYHGQVVHGKAFLMGVNDDLLVSSALVDMYCKCGVTRDAWTIFSTMQTRNVVSWNSMIGGYALNGQDLEALSLYENMLEENLKPDSVTFVGVLSACVHAGLVEEGKEYFSSMNDQHGLEPTLDHYACMVNLFGRSGHMDKAVDLISSMSQEPNSLIWTTVLSVCVMKGDIKHGEMAARCLIELNPFNAVPYIMLSNMYAARGRWKDVASIRSLMKSKHVKKFSAYSWIEIDNEVHKFVADDRSHPDAKIIHNIRTCADCHMFMKFVSNIARRPVILRDSNRFHHFVEGKCSCKDCWGNAFTQGYNKKADGTRLNVLIDVTKVYSNIFSGIRPAIVPQCRCLRASGAS